MDALLVFTLHTDYPFYTHHSLCNIGLKKISRPIPVHIT